MGIVPRKQTSPTYEKYYTIIVYLILTYVSTDDVTSTCINNYCFRNSLNNSLI